MTRVQFLPSEAFANFLGGVGVDALRLALRSTSSRLRSLPSADRRRMRDAVRLVDDAQLRRGIGRLLARLASEADIPEALPDSLRSEMLPTLHRLIEWQLAGIDESTYRTAYLEWQRVVRLYIASPDERAAIDRLFHVLDSIAREAVSQARGWGATFADKASASIHLRAIQAELAALQRSLDRIAWQGESSAAELPASERKLRDQVQYYHRYISPPDFQRHRRVPFLDLYIRPRVEPLGAESSRIDQRKSVDSILAEEQRLVILGSPGAGKSTFANYACLKYSSDSEPEPGALRVTPILIVLRTAVQEQSAGVFDVRVSIVGSLQYLYQFRVSDVCLEHLLATGSLMLIFDGLDELLDTSKRRAVATAIEAFCNAYPRSRVVVTSRRVGYEQAALDTTEFDTYCLTDFDSDDVGEYVTKWFRIHASEYHNTATDRLTTDFLHESRAVAELRTNPLLLSLMCILYRGHQYIPQNRPEVYEACAKLLFSDWDKHRRITGPTTYDSQTQFLLQHVAGWIMSSRTRESGCPELELSREVVAYLNERVYDDAERAAEAGADFFDYCRGRSWILSEVGTTASGTGIWAFTHRTFLEYFAGLNLARVSPSLGPFVINLLTVLPEPRYEVVAQIAVYKKVTDSAIAADFILKRLLREADRGQQLSERLLGFCCRILQLVTPTPPITARIVSAAMKHDVALMRETTIGPKSRAPSFFLVLLLNARLELLPVIQRGMLVGLRDLLGADPEEGRMVTALLGRVAAEATHAFQPTLSDPDPWPDNAEGLLLWQEISRDLIEETRAVLQGQAAAHSDSAVTLLRLGQIPVQDVVARHGWASMFAAGPHSEPYALEALDSLGPFGFTGRHKEWLFFDAFGSFVWEKRPPFIFLAPLHISPHALSITPIEEVSSGPRSLAGVCATLCILDELTGGDMLDSIEHEGLGDLDDIRELMIARRQSGPWDVRGMWDNLRFVGKFREVLCKWGNGSVNFVGHR